MSLFDLLFRKSRTAAQTQSASPNRGSYADEGPLKYNPDFIPQLMDEHRSLLHLFGAIQESHRAKDFVTVKRTLQKFQMTLNLHLALENAHFYAYLRRNLKKNSKDHRTMVTFWDEMQEIGKVVTQFLRKYNYSDFTPDMQASFGPELEQIGAALVTRIKHEEESLYSLYLPHYGGR